MQNQFYPEAFLKNMQQLLGQDFNAFIESLSTSSPTSIRLNPFKPSQKFEGAVPVEWSNYGRYLETRPSFTFDPLFHAGAYYVQEASSMFVEQAMQAINPDNAKVRVLDMCAAPGGKTTHLLSLISQDSLLVSNEIIPGRNKILQENVTKWGVHNVIVTQNKPQDFTKLEGFFDIILIDAPCSGEGLFRKDKDAIDEWSVSNVEVCSIRQKDILSHALACLKPGGFIIYSTCTYEAVENDENIEWAIEQLPVVSCRLPVQFAGLTSTKYGLQFFPHKIKGEGFYISLLKKEGGLNPNALTENRISKTNAVLSNYLEQPETFTAIEKGDLLVAIPNAVKSDYLGLTNSLNVRHGGLLVGSKKGRDFIPAHDLAVSVHVRKDLPKVELSLEQAVAYLRCDPVKLDTDIKGWCLVTYQGFNLGWVKVLDTRVNNYYPREWRILKQGSF